MPLRVPAGRVRPAPKVSSAMLRVRFGIAPPGRVGDPPAFERLLHARLRPHRRKTLENNLQDSYPNLKQHLRLLNIEGSRRAETLSVVEFARLAERSRGTSERSTTARCRRRDRSGKGDGRNGRADDRRFAWSPSAGWASSASTPWSLEWQDHLLLVDAGVMFPSAEMPGVDSIVPDFEYLAAARGEPARDPAHARPRGPHRRARVRAAGRAGTRLRQPPHAGLRAPAPAGARHERRPAHAGAGAAGRARALPRPPHPRRAQRPRQPGPGHRDAGRGRARERRLQDRPERAAPRSAPTSRRSAAWGDRGVLALLSDSTNVEQRGRTGGEDDVVPAFEQVFAPHAGARARLLLRHLDPPHPARGRRGAGARALGRLPGPAHGGQRRGGAGPRPAARPAVRARRPAARRTRCRRGACALRLGQPGRAAVGPLADQRRRAPERSRWARATRSCSRRASSPATSARSRA